MADDEDLWPDDWDETEWADAKELYDVFGSIEKDHDYYKIIVDDYTTEYFQSEDAAEDYILGLVLESSAEITYWEDMSVDELRSICKDLKLID